MSSKVLALCGPTGSGKTAVACALALQLREQGTDAVAVNCDSMQVYAGLPILTSQPSPAELEVLEHRLLGFVSPTEQYSAGRYAREAHEQIDATMAADKLPIVVGGTGLYMRAALCELELRPPVDDALRAAVETEIAERGAEAMHAELPAEQRDRIHPHDQKRIARTTELLRSGIDPPLETDNLWTVHTRHPTLIVGLALEREALTERIERRTETMLAAGVVDEVRAVEALGPSRTIRLAHGYRELLDGRIEDWKRAQRDYARRQMTWIRKTPGVELIDRTELSDDEVAARIRSAL